MNWDSIKNFFKPNAGKTMIFILIEAMWILSKSFSFFGDIIGVINLVGKPITWLFGFSIGFLFRVVPTVEMILIPIILLMVLWHYATSCIIFYIYRRLVKK